MAEGLTLNFDRAPVLCPTIGVRLSPTAMAKFATLRDELGCKNATLLRELIDRGWRDAFGHSIEDPAAACTVSEANRN